MRSLTKDNDEKILRHLATTQSRGGHRCCLFTIQQRKTGYKANDPIAYCSRRDVITKTVLVSLSVEKYFASELNELMEYFST